MSFHAYDLPAIDMTLSALNGFMKVDTNETRALLLQKVGHDMLMGNVPLPDFIAGALRTAYRDWERFNDFDEAPSDELRTLFRKEGRSGGDMSVERLLLACHLAAHVVTAIRMEGQHGSPDGNEPEDLCLRRVLADNIFSVARLEDNLLLRTRSAFLSAGRNSWKGEIAVTLCGPYLNLGEVKVVEERIGEIYHRLDFRFRTFAEARAALASTLGLGASIPTGAVQAARLEDM